MLFNSYEFIFVFLPITLFGFFYIGAVGHHRIAIAWLVAASLIYYGWWNPLYLSLIMGSIFFNYSLGVVLGQRQALPDRWRLGKRGLLAFGIAANLGLLGYFKYANFFVDTFNFVAGTSINLEKIILPLAISFFTFQQVAYLVDAYRKEAREYNFLHYCLFVCFFPQLIAGPIVHHKEVLPQFANEALYKPCSENIAVGITVFFVGLFKKVVLADNLALYVDPVFGSASHPDLVQSWIGALAYTFQLYFDFSGYSDMAIGASRMFGIRLPVNFNSPYKAQSIIEFWRRWHITLSVFLRDYLYFPLGGNRKGQVRRHANLMLTMLLGGLWHGAGWTFVAWGGLHGIYLVLNHVFRSVTLNLNIEPDNILFAVGSRAITFIAVVVGWVFFRAQDFSQASNILWAMVGGNGMVPINIGEDVPAMVLLAVCFFIVWFLPNVQEYMARFGISGQVALEKRRGAVLDNLFVFQFNKLNVAVTSLIILVSFLMMQSVIKSEFLYYDF